MCTSELARAILARARRRIDHSGSIVERQIDRTTRERKYVFNGRNLAGDPLGLVAKVGAAGKAVIITVYREEEA